MNEPNNPQIKPKQFKLRLWLWVILFIAVIFVFVYAGWQKYMDQKNTSIPDQSNISKSAVANKSFAFISITFKDNIDRTMAEKILEQYGEKQDDIAGLYQMVSLNSAKTGWFIFQGRIYDFELKLKSTNVDQDVLLLKNNLLFTNVEPYCMRASEKKPSCIHLEGRADIDSDTIIDFIKSKNFEIQKESVNPIYASFYAPRDRQNEWVERLKNDSNFKTIRLDYPI